MWRTDSSQQSTLVGCLLFGALAITIVSASCAASGVKQAKPQPGDEWDLVVISDSSMWYVAPLYAACIEEDLGVVVAPHTCIRGGLPAQFILDAMGWDPELQDLIRKAEVITVYGNPEGLETGQWDCFD